VDVNQKHSVLIVEDEIASLNLLASYFETEDYIVYKARDSSEAEAHIETKAINVILMDIKIPGKDGLELTREIRILVTQKKDDIDKIVGLELGADDYVTKPYNPRELLVRVKNLIHRSQSKATAKQHSLEGSKYIVFPPWTLHLGRRLLQKEGQEDIQMTEGEFKLLTTLIQNSGSVLSRDQIMNQMQRRDWFPTDKTRR